MASVLISGVFDPLHAGHLLYIAHAKQLGMVTAIVSDDPSRHPPLVPIAEREYLLEAIGCDVALRVFTVADAIRRTRPAIFLKGREWEGKLPQDILDACAATGTEIRYCDTRVNSSSALLADYERRRNAEKLAAFEMFVQAQKPAEKPWEPVTDYSWEARSQVEKPHAEIIKAVLQPKCALDVGAGYGHLVRLLRSIGVTAIGLEPHLKPSPEVASFVFTGLFGIAKEWDLVICREVLEHLTVRELRDKVRFLVGVSTRYVYVTTRFSAGAHLLDVDGADDLDPTHITMLNQDLLRTLFVLEGCTRRADLEQRLDWQHKGRVLVYEVSRG